ncbi:hypothetical protein BaRGS_00032788, partial [Batillaria attramentaria]
MGNSRSKSKGNFDVATSKEGKAKMNNVREEADSEAEISTEDNREWACSREDVEEVEKPKIEGFEADNSQELNSEGDTGL